MSRPSVNLIWTPEFSDVSDTDIILSCVDTICIDDLSNIEMVIDDEWFLKFLSDFFCLMGFLKYFVFWCILAAKLDNISTELESSAEYCDIMRYEIDSPEFPGFSQIQETISLEVVEFIAEYPESIIPCVFLENTKSLLGTLHIGEEEIIGIFP